MSSTKQQGNIPGPHPGHKRKRFLEHWKVIAFYLVLYDIVAVNVSYFFGLLLRFDLRYTSIPPEYLDAFLRFAPFYTVFTLAVFYFLRLYNSIWRFASFSELNRIFAATLITTGFQIIGITLFFERMPFSYYVIGCLTQFLLVVAVRFVYRYITLERTRREKNTKPRKNAMVIGAGAAGQVILKELKSSTEAAARPCCVIDDNSNKWGRFMEGVPIVGGRDSILSAVKKYQIDQILFAIPTASPREKRDILNICKETRCELKSLPGVYQLANGQVSLSKMKAVAVEDLLGREPIKVNLDEIFQYIKGKTILVTGGGGSIGSELCRQIAAHEPGRLIIFDIYENNAYEIEQELRRRYPGLNLEVLIGSVRDSRRINAVFDQYRPDIVYHAAAHKHVPLMEASPNEAIKNNVAGTYKTAYAALKHGTKRFVLISTDKAVNPTNIMGASKRLCEMVIQSMDAISKAGREDLLPFLHAHMDKVIDGQKVPDPMDHMAVEGFEKNPADAADPLAAALSEAAVSQENTFSETTANRLLDFSKSSLGNKSTNPGRVGPLNNREHSGTQFVAVRFGNVLGSNGSVIPLFKKQIEAGGPVTVTHPDIVRYFMTIPEAVSLVLQAGTYALGGEIFVLDMGDPVKIDHLARNLIKLSGFEPDVDIQITYTGLRPGEKLYEEKLMAEEGLKKTENKLIHIGKPIPFNIEKFLKELEELAKTSYENSDRIVEMVEQMVPTFHPEKDQKKSNKTSNDVPEISSERKKGNGFFMEKILAEAAVSSVAAAEKIEEIKRMD